MKKVLFFYFFLVLLGLNAQTTINIGNGTSMGDAPYSTNVEYNYTQSLYLASEIGTSGFITEIEWTLNTSGNIDNSDDLTVYMVETTRDQFDGDTSTAGAPFNFLTQVFSGTVTENAGKVNVTLDTPFYYTGDNNLIIAVNETSAGINLIGMSFFFNATNSSTPRSILNGQAGAPINPSSGDPFLGKENEYANIEITIDNNCTTMAIPFTENFDSLIEIQSGQPYRTTPSCWTVLSSSGNIATGTSDSGFSNIFTMRNNSGSSDFTLVTPEISNLSNGNNIVTLRFGGTAGGEQVIVGTMSDPNNVSTFSGIETLTASSSISNPSVGLAEFQVEIPNGSNNYLAFRHGNASGTSPIIFLEDISISDNLSTIDANSSKNSLKVYQSSDYHRLYIDSKQVVKSFKVYSSTGKQINLKGTNQNKSVDISSLSSGVYLIQVEIENGFILTKKFIKK